MRDEGRCRVGGASRDSTGFVAMEEGLISSGVTQKVFSHRADGNHRQEYCSDCVIHQRRVRILSQPLLILDLLLTFSGLHFAYLYTGLIPPNLQRCWED